MGDMVHKKIKNKIKMSGGGGHTVEKCGKNATAASLSLNFYHCSIDPFKPFIFLL